MPYFNVICCESRPDSGGPVPWVCVGLVEMVNGELARVRRPNLQLICQVDCCNPF